MLALLLAAIMTTTPAQDAALVNAYITQRASVSLEEALRYTVIDARPEPKAFGLLAEPWQGELILKPIVPAVEQICGMRSDYKGPTYFLFVLPKGHDKTGLLGRIANASLAFAKRRLRIACAASTRDQARLLAKSMDDELRLNAWLKRRVTYYKHEVHGPGGTLEVLSSEATSSSGRKDDIVILDEWSFWEDRELFDMLYGGAAKRPGSVLIIISNAGMKGSWQHKMLAEVKEDPKWHVYESPVGEQLASWMDPATVATISRGLRPGFARRVIGNQWIDATETPLLDEALIRSCVGPCLWSPQDWQAQPHARLYAGVDFGRTKNRTVIWTVEAVRGVAVTREIRVLHQMAFADQEAILRKLATDPRLVSMKLDKGAQGWTTTENLERDFPNKCEGKHLGGGYRATIAANLKASFAERLIEVPDDPEMVADLQRVSEVETVNGKPALKVDESEDGMHADHFWAGALAVDAADIKNERAVPMAPMGWRS